ncbi:hypothetical protein AVEN_59963-1 [Araneus ventricosus]|uniref:Uncharacterized protein n=1 Tax=Araneus ventricosus TaxID=182803 RepID=A0A4Y2RWH1_ARAVE|nr:hypothetical protein AVEN_59963-1 [Araneus ventricosus]
MKTIPSYSHLHLQNKSPLPIPYHVQRNIRDLKKYLLKHPQVHCLHCQSLDLHQLQIQRKYDDGAAVPSVGHRLISGEALTFQGHLQPTKHVVIVKQAINLSSKLEFLEHVMEKPLLTVEIVSNLEQMIRNGGIQQNIKSKTESADSILRPRCEGSGKTKDLPTLAPGLEIGNETRNPPRGGRGVWVAGILRL